MKQIKVKQDAIFNEIKSMKVDISEAQKETIKHVDDKLKKCMETVKHNHINHVTTTVEVPRKKKILFIGDSLSRNLNVSVLKNVTDMEVRKAEAFIVDKNDVKARYPEKNLMDVVPRELKNDAFSTLILQGGTNEVSNLVTSGEMTMEKIDSLKHEIKASSEKIFNIAEKSLAQNEGLENVIIFKRMFRCDIQRNDPAQIKNHLSKHGNRVLDDIWLSKGCPQNIKIVQQGLNCNEELRSSRFGHPTAQGYDGVHMRGKLSVQHYTGSVLNALMEAVPSLSPTPPTQSGAPTYASIVRNDLPYQKSQPNHKRQVPRSSQAQPQVNSNVHGNSGPQHHQQNNTGFTNTPVTGVNRIPLGGNQKYYNVKTQNRFSPVSGN